MKKSLRVGTLFVLPAMVLVGVFSIYPLAQTLYLSFFKYNMMKPAGRRFVGFGNYLKLFGNPEFLLTLRVTLYYTLWGVSATMVFGVALALLLNRGGRIVALLRSVSLMPMLICGVALAVAWQLVYNSSFGALNALLGLFGIAPVNFLGDVKVALYALIAIDVWQFTPFVMILTTAGLQGISPELYEAAAMDGANYWRRFWHITLPSLQNVLLMTMVLRIIDTFKTFEKPFILTRGGPAMTTTTINLFIYDQAFSRNEMGYGAASAFVISAIIGVLSIAFVYLSTRTTGSVTKRATP
jgi:multiple sugar transport system permease protein